MNNPLKKEFNMLRFLYNSKAISAKEYMEYERALAEQFLCFLEGKSYTTLDQIMESHKTQLCVPTSPNTH